MCVGTLEPVSTSEPAATLSPLDWLSVFNLEFLVNVGRSINFWFPISGPARRCVAAVALVWDRILCWFVTYLRATRLSLFYNVIHILTRLLEGLESGGNIDSAHTTNL